MYEYRVIEAQTEEGTPAYGLELYMNGRLLCTLPQIAPERERVERIAALCTVEQVEPVHVQDVVYDMTH